jgi:hypothetical protein
LQIDGFAHFRADTFSTPLLKETETRDQQWIKMACTPTRMIRDVIPPPPLPPYTVTRFRQRRWLHIINRNHGAIKKKLCLLH